MNKSSIRPLAGIHHLVGLIFVAMVTALPAQPSQPGSAPLSSFPKQDEALERARALEIRQSIVELAGEREVEQFNHPQSGYPTQADTFVEAFTMLFYGGLEQVPDEKSGTSKSIIARKPTWFKIYDLFTRIVGSPPVPYLDTAIEIVGINKTQKAQAELDAAARRKHESALGELHTKEAGRLAQAYLTSADFQTFSKGDLITKSALLFKAATLIVERQAVPNGFTLWMCDARGGDGKRGHGAREQLLSIAPNDDRLKEIAWDRLSDVQQWHVTTEIYKNYMESIYQKMNDDATAASELESIAAHTGANAPTAEDKILLASGPEGLAAFQAARPEDRDRMVKSAQAFHAAISMVIPLLIGDNGNAK